MFVTAEYHSFSTLGFNGDFTISRISPRLEPQRKKLHCTTSRGTKFLLTHLFSVNRLYFFITSICRNFKSGQLYYDFSAHYIRIYPVNTVTQMEKEVG